jgi:hypothetical protein
MMGRKSGERMMGLLEGRVETISGEFNVQTVANTLWAYATIGGKTVESVNGSVGGTTGDDIRGVQPTGC